MNGKSSAAYQQLVQSEILAALERCTPNLPAEAVGPLTDCLNAATDKINDGLETIIADITTVHTAALTRVQQEKEKRLADVKLAHEKQVIDLQEKNMKEEEDLHNQLRQMKENHEEEILDAEDGVRRRWMARMDAQEEDYKAIIEELKQQHTAEIEELEKQMDDKLELTRSASVAQLDGVENFARQRLAQKEAELATYREDTSGKLHALADEKDAVVAKLQADHKDTIQKMEQESSTKLHEMHEKHKQERMDMEREIKADAEKEMELKYVGRLIEMKAVVDNLSTIHSSCMHMQKVGFGALDRAGWEYERGASMEMGTLLKTHAEVSKAQTLTEEANLCKEVGTAMAEYEREARKVRHQQKKLLEQAALVQELGKLVNQVERKSALEEGENGTPSPRSSEANRKRWSLLQEGEQNGVPTKRKSGDIMGDWNKLSPRKG